MLHKEVLALNPLCLEIGQGKMNHMIELAKRERLLMEAGFAILEVKDLGFSLIQRSHYLVEHGVYNSYDQAYAEFWRLKC